MAVTTGLVGAARIYAKQSIIHRDISHGNLLIAEGPTFTRCCNRWAGLIDFDMAKRDSGVDNTTVDEGTFPDRTGTDCTRTSTQLLTISQRRTEYHHRQALTWSERVADRAKFWSIPKKKKKKKKTPPVTTCIVSFSLLD